MRLRFGEAMTTRRAGSARTAGSLDAMSPLSFRGVSDTKIHILVQSIVNKMPTNYRDAILTQNERASRVTDNGLAEEGITECQRNIEILLVEIISKAMLDGQTDENSIVASVNKNNLMRDIFLEVLGGDIPHIEATALKFSNIGFTQLGSGVVRKIRNSLLSETLMDARMPLESLSGIIQNLAKSKARKVADTLSIQ